MRYLLMEVQEMEELLIKVTECDEKDILLKDEIFSFGEDSKIIKTFICEESKVLIEENAISDFLKKIWEALLSLIKKIKKMFSGTPSLDDKIKEEIDSIDDIFEILNDKEKEYENIQESEISDIINEYFGQMCLLTSSKDLTELGNYFDRLGYDWIKTVIEVSIFKEDVSKIKQVNTAIDPKILKPFNSDKQIQEILFSENIIGFDTFGYTSSNNRVIPNVTTRLKSKLPETDIKFPKPSLTDLEKFQTSFAESKHLKTNEYERLLTVVEKEMKEEKGNINHLKVLTKITKVIGKLVEESTEFKLTFYNNFRKMLDQIVRKLEKEKPVEESDMSEYLNKFIF